MSYFDEPYLKYDVLSLDPDEEDFIRTNYMPHFLFYRRMNKRDIDFYCTACTNRQVDDKSIFSGASAALKHKTKGICPICGTDVQFRQMDYGRRTYQYWDNFVLVRPQSEDEVHLECVGVRQYFEEDDMMPRLEAFHKQQYILRLGNVTRYGLKWEWGGEGYQWAEVKKISEPHFFSLPFYNYCLNNGYYFIGEEKLRSTFLRYAFDCISNVPRNTVQYLCKFAQHPNLEYLMRGGFENIGRALSKGGCGIYINWKSNDLKKMLRLSKSELELFRECEVDQYRSYIILRRKLGLCSDKVFKYYQHFGTGQNIQYLDAICSTVKIAWKPIMDYVLKVVSKNKDIRDHQALHDYYDYIRECVKLEYDLKSRIVLFPKDLYEAHQRNQAAIKAVTDAMYEAERKKADEQRGYLKYTDEQRGLAVILPSNLEDIVYEGATLEHCVGGYADRHAMGALHIVFLRRLDDLETPFYTMEISTSGRIVQCRGFRNNVESRGGKPKTQEIIDFEQDYQQYLIRAMAEIKGKKHKKVRKSA